MAHRLRSTSLALVVVTFAAWFCVLAFCDLVRPEPYGYAATFRSGGLVITSIDPDGESPAVRADLRLGDVLTSANGHRINDADDWAVIEATLGFSVPLRLTIRRGSDTLERTLVLARAGWQFWATAPGVVLLITLTVQFVALMLAAVIIARRPTDSVAVLGAWALLTVSVYVIVLPYRFAAVWRELPLAVGGLLWLPFACGQAAAAVLCTFFLSFPRRTIRSPALWVALWTPMAIALVGPVHDAWLSVARPADVVHPIIRHVPFTLTVGYLLAGVAILVWNYWRLTDANERRRVRIVVIGATAGLTPGLSVIALAGLRSEPAVTASIFTSPVIVTGTLTLLLFPVSLAYAILRHRVFDIRLMVRQGVRYAVARGALLSVVPVLALILFADVLARGEVPLLAILQARAGIYGAIAGGALVAHVRRTTWLEALDRHFFREQYQAERVLAQVADDIRQLGDFETVAPRVVAYLERALHPEFVALLVRHPSEFAFTPVVATPAGLAPPPLRVDSTLVALLRVSKAPVDLAPDTTTSMAHHLPLMEQAMVRQAGLELLLPIVGSPDHAEAVLTFGMKRSEEPYTPHDRDLLAIISTQLALLLDRPLLPSTTKSSSITECPKCGACYDVGREFCVNDGAALTPMHLPRLLVGRYRIERRLGQGGLGTVYEALDTALDRRVAIKTLREARVTYADAWTTFQHEARLAARFVHPNVVTVHDFGVDATGRAFLVMECLDGTTLRHALRRDGRFQPARTLAIMRDVCAAVDAAHRRQLVHCDLKPENVVLVTTVARETAKVLDFGVARAVDDGRGLSDRVALAGSLRYMSPGQLRGEALDPSVDVWALGIIAYEMVTGVHPFAGHPLHMVSADVLDDPRRIAGVLTDTPAAWVPFFRRALALEPEQAPKTAAVFLAELETALLGMAA